MSEAATPWPLPVSWAWLPTAKVGDVGLGRQRSPENHAGPHMRAYLRSANITWEGWDLNDVKEMNFDNRDFATFQLQAGDVLLNEGSGSAGEVGKPAVWEGQIPDCCFQNTLLRFRSPHVDPWYARAFFSYSARAGHLVRHTQGVNIIHIGKKGLEELSLPVAPMPEQRRIVAKIDRLSARSKRARDELGAVSVFQQRYRNAMLQAAIDGGLTADWRVQNGFEWRVNPRTIEDLAVVVTGSTPPSKGKNLYFDGATPFIKPSDLDREYYIDRARETLSEVGAGILRAVPARSTLLTCIGATIGKTGFVRVECRTNQQINALIPRSGCLAEWLYWSVISPHFQRQVIESSSATTMPIINKSRLQRLTLPSVSVEEQAEIVRRIEHAFAAMDRLAAEARSARALVDKLDQAILAKAFRGELVPQDANDEPASVLLERIRAERAAAHAKPRYRSQQ